MEIRREEQPKLNAYERFIELRRTITIDDKKFDKEFMDDRAAPVATEEEFETLRKSFEDWINRDYNPQKYAYYDDVDLTDWLALEQLYFRSPAPQPLDEMENY